MISQQVGMKDLQKSGAGLTVLMDISWKEQKLDISSSCIEKISEGGGGREEVSYFNEREN